MTPFRRKPPDPEIAAARDAFRRVTAELDAAQRTLLAAVPTARGSGTPLKQAVEEFLVGLTRAETAMSGWRIERTEPLWRRCAEALVEARTEAQRLRDDPEAEGLGFEPLNARLGDLVSPLEEFADVAADIRRL